MRLLLLNYEYPPLGGGAAVAMAELARGFAGSGAVVEIVTSGPAANEGTSTTDTAVGAGRLIVHRVHSKRKGVHQAGMGGAGSYLVSALPVVRRLVSERTYDMVHVFFSLPTGALLPFLRLKGAPVVVSLRGSDVPGYDMADVKLRVMHRILLPLTRWIWRRSDRVVALSDGLGELALRTAPALRYGVIRNGVDVAMFRPPSPPRVPRADLVRCVAVARLIERKGIGNLLEALALLERGRFKLEIIGSGRDEAALIARSERLGLTEDVHFAGALGREGVAECYRRADLFTLVPENEAFGNVFAEALASGLPIVASNVGGIPEFVVHERNGLLVPPGNPRALADAIRYLADRPERRAEMTARNREYAGQELSWRRATHSYLDLYQELMTRSPATAPSMRPDEPLIPSA